MTPWSVVVGYQYFRGGEMVQGLMEGQLVCSLSLPCAVENQE
jgi:hypothetical protein